MKRRALITGATGFVGSHLAEQLAGSGAWELRALVRPGSDRALLQRLGAELVEGDLEDDAALLRAADGVDTVFHLAAMTFGPSEAAFRRANAEGTRRLVQALQAAPRRPRRLVFLSSYAACGPAAAGRPRRLEEAPAPLTAYGRSKLAAEEIVRSAARGGVEVVVVRAPAVYGPRDRALLSYFRLVRWWLAPAPAGERWLHLVYAPDLARALGRAADAPEGIYPVAEPVVHRWSEVVEAIAHALHRRPFPLPLPTPLVRVAAAATESLGRLRGTTPPFNREKAEEMLAEAWTCDLNPSRTLLPPAEATRLAEGIAQTVQWYTRQGWL